MTSSKTPPRIAQWLLSRAVPTDVREEFLGDLAEDWFEHRSRLRYWRQTIEIAWRFYPLRRAEASSRRRGHLDILVANLRYGLRIFARQPLWSVLAIAALGIGIGVTSTAFSIVYGSLYRGLPFEDADALIHFERRDEERGRDLPVAPHDYVAWREQQSSFEDIGAYVEHVIVLNGEDGRPEREIGIRMSANSFAILRARAALGRVFEVEEDRPGSPPVILIGHHVWQNRYGGRADIVGRTIRVNGEPTTVIGVMPPEFAFPVSEQFWSPLRLDLSSVARGDGRLDAFGRLTPEASLHSARAELEAISARLAQDFPDSHRGVVPVLQSFAGEYVGDAFARLVAMMLLGAALVLVIACINVGTLLSAQAAKRAGELAVRSSLGASRGRLLEQLLTEAFLLSALGGVVGIVIARWGLAWFNLAWSRAGDLGLPHGPDGLFWWRFELDAVPMAFVAATTLLTVIVTAILPGWNAARATTRPGWRGGHASETARSRRASSWLVLSQVALTTSLLFVAGLTIESVRNLTRLDYGVAIEDVTVARLGLPDDAYPDEASRRRFWLDLLERIEEAPGMDGVALATTVPLRISRISPVALDGRSDIPARDLPRVRTSTISDRFFETFGVRLVEGRGLAGAGQQQVALVNESFARRFFPQGAIGRRIRAGAEEPWRTVIGIAPNLWMEGSHDKDAAGIYLPLTQSRSPYGLGLRYLNVVLRTSSSSSAAGRQLRGVVASMDEELPVYNIGSMRELVETSTGSYRVYGTFYVALGLIALFIASLGLYGILSLDVAKRVTDIGVRMAFGARAKDVERMVLKRGMRPVFFGVVLGALGASWLARAVERALFEVEPLNATIVIGVAITLTMSAGLACYLPARRAARIAPIEAIRNS